MDIMHWRNACLLVHHVSGSAKNCGISKKNHSRARAVDFKENFSSPKKTLMLNARFILPVNVRGETALWALVAESPLQLGAAHDLVSTRYAWRGYEISTRQQVQLGKSSKRLRREITFLTATSQAALGTLTLRLDGPEGLLAEKTHEGIIDRSRVAGRKVCELTRLAVAENADSKVVLAALFSIAHAVCCEMHDVTDAFIEVNPRHVGFYSRVLGFAVAAGEKLCERVQAPSVLLRSEVEAIGDRLRYFGGDFLLDTVHAKAA